MERRLTSALASIQADSSLEAMLDEAPFGIYLDGPEKGCVYANRTLLEQFGVSWSEFEGFGWASLVDPRDVDGLRSAIHRFEHDLGIIDVRYRVKRPDGAERWIRARVQALRGPSGAHIGSLGTTEDVTEQRLDQARVTQAQKLEAVGRLSGRVAHDLNNLLGVIMLTADGLRAQLADPELRSMAEAIVLSVEQASQVTGQLLVLSGKRVAAARRCSLDEELRRLAVVLERTLGEGMTLELTTEAPTAQVALDPGQVGQVVLNLATNARDACRGHGRLSLATRRFGDVVEITVEDDGEGMDDHVLAEASRPFFTTKAPDRGTGLGLATVADTVTTVGGTIELASRVGEGTTVTVRLPVLDRSVVPVSNDRRAEARRGEGLRVLLLEDHDAIRQSIAYALSMQGYQVSAARDVTAASGEERDFDLVVTDALLPDGYGVDFLNEHYPDLPAVVISGFVGDAESRIQVAHPHRRFLQKPFAPYQLLLLLSELQPSAMTNGSEGRR